MKVICFIILISNYCLAQEPLKLFNSEFSKIGFIFQPSRISGFEVSKNSSPTIHFNKTFSAQIGIAYNFAQYKNFNFRAAILAKIFNPSFDIKLSNDDLNAGYNYQDQLTDFFIKPNRYFTIPKG